MLLILRPAQFLSLVGRAFAPFGSASAIAKQTELTLLQPAGGDATVPVNQSIEFRVQVDGRIPDASADDAVRLRMKYNPADTVWEERRLDPSTRDPREWSVRVPALAVQNGFVYQIAAGDAVTPGVPRQRALLAAHRGVRRSLSLPPVSALHGSASDESESRIAPRHARHDDGEDEPPRAKTAGCDSTRSTASRTKPSIAGELVADQPNALRFRFTMEHDGKYRIHFRSLEGDENQDPIPYTIKVLSDHPPQVEITRAAADGLAINGTLSVEGKASDDFGITKMRLCGRFFENDKDEQPKNLIEKPFRDGKSFRFEDGTFPRALDYKETAAARSVEAQGRAQADAQGRQHHRVLARSRGQLRLSAAECRQIESAPRHARRSEAGRRKEASRRSDQGRQAGFRRQARSGLEERERQQESRRRESAEAAGEQQPDKKANPDKTDKPDPNAAQPPENGDGQGDNPPMDPNQKAEEDKAKDLAKKLQDKLQDKKNEANQPKGESKPDQNQQDPNGAQPDGGAERPVRNRINRIRISRTPARRATPSRTRIQTPAWATKARPRARAIPSNRRSPANRSRWATTKNQGGDQNQPKPDDNQGAGKPSQSQGDKNNNPGAGKSEQPKNDNDQPKPDPITQAQARRINRRPTRTTTRAPVSQSNRRTTTINPSPIPITRGTGKANQPQTDQNNNQGAGKSEQPKNDDNQPKPDPNNPGTGKANQPQTDKNNNQGAGKSEAAEERRQSAKARPQ